MQYEYDSWNRIQTMTYPDGEVVTYGYNQGGMLKSVVGNKNGVFSDYIKEIHYNKYELKDTVSYGNGTGVRYMYDSLLRLSHLRSACADGTMQDIVYTYDSVSNITGITNSAGLLPNGLGGPYYNHYAYDDLCRLILAEGEWNGNSSLRHGTYMRYEQNGRLSRKIQIADTWLDGNPATVAYDNCYHYEEPQPNTLTRIVEGENHREMLEELGAQIEQIPDKLPSFTQMFEWDATGNMVYHSRDGNSFGRQLCWDEQNRLLGVKDNGYLSYYQYDANGDRTYKLTGEYAAQNRSGQWHYYYLLNSPTLYASPYLVTDKKGYTKHYYAESERIASRIGGGGLHDLHKGFEEYPELAAIHNESSANLFGKVMECLVADALPQEDALQYLYDWQEFVEEEKECYWYHPDHLGSSSWITYSDGKAVQHLHYLPWGEDFVNQRLNSFDGVRYTFSAKEKDVETGLSYFGSRYYSSDLSVWLSADPMSDKYASLSPYTYCANNPVWCVDPNGEDIGDYYNQYGTYLGTDCIDDGKIHIVDEQSWNNLYKDMFSFQMDNGTTYISSVMASDNPSCPNLFSQKPTNANLSDEAILNILQQYNTTGIELQINNEKGSLTTTFVSDKEMFLTANVNDWRHSSFLNDYFEIYSSFDNENGHIEQHAELKHGLYSQLTKYERECYAVEYQKKQPVFTRTSSFYQKHVDKYLKSLAP